MHHKPFYLKLHLIDHDIDIKRGIKYVKEALKIEQVSSFYKDSLAWGYFKLRQCKKPKVKFFLNIAESSQNFSL